MRKLLLALAVAGSLTIVACGGGGTGIDNDEADQIREHAAQVQRDAQRTADAVRAGTKDAGQAAEEIQDDMTGLADETIDAAKDENLPDDVKAQLDAAQAQLDAAQK